MNRSFLASIITKVTQGILGILNLDVVPVRVGSDRK